MSGAMFIILYITGSCMKFLRYLVYLYYYIDCLVYVLSMCFRDILSVATVKDQFPVLGSVIEVSLARCALYGGVVGYVGKAAKTPSPKCALLEMDVTASAPGRDRDLHWQSHWRAFYRYVYSRAHQASSCLALSSCPHHLSIHRIIATF